ncbi:MAG: peptidylprolyl isomerase [Planctomycetes bacterium]|nr:peptidylprolyl isomerase [Planctomycetota bacterium]
MKIKHGCIVELTYLLKDEDGEVVEQSGADGPMSYLHGYGEIPSGLEARLDGVEVGAAFEVTLAPGEAFGDYDPEKILAVPRDQFPADAEIVPGDTITVSVADDEDPDSETGEMDTRVVEISPEAIVLDANHPYAGKRMTFDLRVLSIRAASEEELAEHENDDEDDDEFESEEFETEEAEEDEE